MALLLEDAVNLDGEDLVSFLLAVEELGALGGIIDDLGNLKREAGLVSPGLGASHDRSQNQGTDLSITLDWSTESWPALVSDGPRREYLRVACSECDGDSLEGPASSNSACSGNSMSGHCGNAVSS